MDKDMTIFRFPKVLVIHIKRFSGSTSKDRKKLSTPIDIPEMLDMTKYAPYSQHESKSRA